MDNQPIQPPPPPFSPTSPSKTFLLILGAIALIVISAMGGYFIGANRQSSSSQPPNQPSQTFPTTTLAPSPTPSPLPSETSVKSSGETVNWKTYANNGLGISFQYPDDWTLKPRPSFDISRGLDMSPRNSSDPSIIFLQMIDNPEKLSVEERNEKTLKELSVSTGIGQTAIPILSKDSKKVSTSNGINAYYNHEANCVIQCREYVWARADKFYYLYYFYPELPNQEKIFNQIFSTFQFLN